MVKYINDMAEWNALMETSKSKLVVVDFTATWVRSWSSVESVSHCDSCSFV